MKLEKMPNGTGGFRLEQKTRAMRDLNTYEEYGCNVPSYQIGWTRLGVK